MTVAEVGMMHIQPGKTPLAAGTPDERILRDAFESIIVAPGGPSKIFWGIEEWAEKTADGDGRLWGWFEWESLGEHEKFAREFGGDATSRFAEVFAPGFTKHAIHSLVPLFSPVTQVLCLYFDADVSQDTRDAVERGFERLRRHEGYKALKGASGGWGVETDFPHRAGGGTGAVFFALLEREGLEGEIEEARKAVVLAGEMEGCVAWDEFWVRCEVLERGQ